MTSREPSNAQPLAAPGSGMQVNLERTGEGVGYRAVPDPAAVGVPPAPVTERPALLATAHDRIRWGPILAGLVTTITVLTVLMVLALAVGFTVYKPGSSAGNVGTAAHIWSAVSGVLAFLAGGWVAGETAAVSSHGNGALNGFLVGAAALVLILWLAISGLGNLLGAVGSNLGDIARLGMNHVGTQQLGAAAQQAQQSVTSNGNQAANIAQSTAWWTWVVIVVGLICATLGGLIGFHFRGVRLPFNERP